MVQGHPPPILVGYRAENGGNDNNEGLKNNQVSSTELFLSATLDAIRFTKIQQRPSDEEGPYEKERDDVILFLGQNQWIQMPAEVTVRRFLQHKEVLSQRLKREYGLSSSPLPGSSFGIDFTLEGETQTRHNNSTYKLGVLFPASRRKSRLTSQGHKIEKKEQEIDESESHTSSHEGSNIEDQDDILPESSLPEDVYGVFPDAGKSVTSWWRKMGHGNSKMAIPTRYQRPRYLGGRSFMGEVEDVERLLRGAVERVGWLGGDDGTREENLDEGGDELTYLFSEMFFEQEIERRRQQEVALRRQGEDIMRQGEQKGWWSGLWGGNETSNMMNDSDDEEAGDNPDEYEFGITLDYESRIFQDMASYPDLFNTTTHKTSDIRFLSFTRPNLVHSPSRTAAHLYSDPLRLPPELLHPLSPGGRSSPFGLTTTRYNLSEILKAVSHAIDEKLPRGENTASEITMIHWPNLQFATNLVVPRGSVPSILDMARVSSSSGPDSETQTEEKVDSGEIDKYWARMWFQQKQDHNTREQRYTPVKDLLDEYLHPNRYIYALEAAGGGRNWWNMRGGRGGLWTDQGVCLLTTQSYKT